ncbi:MAG: FAD-binding protein [Coriobacteriia bacterium]|nr:FAD-binding protein [Coriobacteriia bacterium]
MAKELLEKGMSRRSFLFGAGAAAGIAAAGLAGCTNDKPAAEAPKETPKEEGEAWDYEADIIVCGTGPAGLCCAAAAAEGGCSVIMIESAKWIGGKGVQAGGNFGVGGGTRMQIEGGFEESEAIIIQDRRENTLRDDGREMTIELVNGVRHTMPQWRKISGCDDYAGVAEAFAKESLTCWNWLDKMGAKFIRANVSPYANVYRGSRAFTTTTASPVDRPNWKEGDWVAGGAGIYWPVYDTAIANGAELMTETKMVKIIREDGRREGRVIGVEAELLAEGDKVIKLKANKAVFLGTGSWNCNPALKQFLAPYLVSYPHFSGEPLVNNDGNGVAEAFEIGAAMSTDRGNDWHGWHRHPGTIWHSVSPPFGARGIAEVDDTNCIYVNAEGKRFMNEQIGEDNPAWLPGCKPFYFAQIAGEQTGDKDGPIVWIVFDEETRAEQELDLSSGPDGAYGVRNLEGMVFSADTVEAAATAAGLNSGNVAAAVARYNELVEGGADLDYEKRGLDRTISTPPFHLVKWGIQKHNTLGGAAMNGKAQILDWKGNPIPGLYGAGEATGGMDLIGIAKPTVFGRIAGLVIAAEE